MRKRRQVFWDALLSLGLSWGLARYLNNIDPEANQFLLVGLTALCLIIILPKALHRLPHGRPWSAGFSLPLMLSPLLVILSRPGLYIIPFAALWQERSDLIIPWSVNGFINFWIFFLIGFATARSGNEDAKSITWTQSFLSAGTLLLLYGGIIYLGINVYF